MARPRKEPGTKADYHTSAKSKAWLVCACCDRSIPYAGNSDPEHGDGWPLHRCPAQRNRAMPFTRYTTTDPNPPLPPLVWDDDDQPTTKPELIIG